MKQLIVAVTLALGLTVTYSHAQMGHGMMRGTDNMGGDHMTEEGHMAAHDRMMNNMMGISNDMSGMIRQMAEMMGDVPDTGRDTMQKMSGIMRDMSAELNRMSWIMGQGTVTEEEIESMRGRMQELQKQMEEIRRK